MKMNKDVIDNFLGNISKYTKRPTSSEASDNDYVNMIVKISLKTINRIGGHLVDSTVERYQEGELDDPSVSSYSEVYDDSFESTIEYAYEEWASEIDPASPYSNFDSDDIGEVDDAFDMMGLPVDEESMDDPYGEASGVLFDMTYAFFTGSQMEIKGIDHTTIDGWDKQAQQEADAVEPE
jgi:hypothetical protein